ncbi:hypothetical protein N9W70_02065 [Schleiferiaceae bacterium]|nr:hypothetical protein [Schleiferiaceae bacterium]
MKQLLTTLALLIATSMVGQTAWSCKTSGNTFDGYTKVASATSGNPIWRIDNMRYKQSVKRLTIKINSKKDVFITGATSEWCQVAIDNRLFWLELSNDKVIDISTKEGKYFSVISFLDLLKSGNNLQMRIIAPKNNNSRDAFGQITKSDWSPTRINPLTGTTLGGDGTPIADFRFSLKNSGASIDCAIK